MKTRVPPDRPLHWECEPKPLCLLLREREPSIVTTIVVVTRGRLRDRDTSMPMRVHRSTQGTEVSRKEGGVVNRSNNFPYNSPPRPPEDSWMTHRSGNRDL